MSKGRRYAVLIGSSSFDKEPKLTPLKCPGNDVDGMREILAAAELGAFEEPFVFKNAESHVVARRIGKVLVEASNHDHVLIYYSGHGETDLPGHLYLATANTEINNLIATSIPVDQLQVMISQSSCRKIMLILDCCYGGAAGKSFTIRGSIDENLKELARGSGVYILTASTASQTAQEREGDDYGLLTKHIISGIRQGAADANDDGFVSMDDLYQYVYTKVKSEGYQEPMRWALNVKGEDLIIARAGGMSIGEQQRLLTEKIIEIRSFLPLEIFTQAIQAIGKRHGPFYETVFKFYRKQWQVGRFLEEWRRIESDERRQAPAQREEISKIDAVESEAPLQKSSLKPQAQARQTAPRRLSLTAAKSTSLTERRPQLVRWVAVAAVALFLVVVAWVWKLQIGVNPAQPSQSAAPSVSPTDRIEPSPTSTPAPTVRTVSSPSQTPTVKSQKSVRDEKEKKAIKIIEEERNRSQP
jgi:Caspase domain